MKNPLLTLPTDPLRQKIEEASKNLGSTLGALTSAIAAGELSTRINSGVAELLAGNVPEDLNTPLAWAILAETLILIGAGAFIGFIAGGRLGYLLANFSVSPFLPNPEEDVFERIQEIRDRFFSFADRQTAILTGAFSFAAYEYATRDKETPPTPEEFKVLFLNLMTRIEAEKLVIATLEKENMISLRVNKTETIPPYGSLYRLKIFLELKKAERKIDERNEQFDQIDFAAQRAFPDQMKDFIVFLDKIWEECQKTIKQTKDDFDL